jgi:dTDP-4-amino-4,6-dideoxygalactose transaminase
MSQIFVFAALIPKLLEARVIGGSVVDAFEWEFADFFGTRHAVGVGNGSDAVRFALIVAGVQANDIVVTVPMTLIATAEAHFRLARGRFSSTDGYDN